MKALPRNTDIDVEILKKVFDVSYDGLCLCDAKGNIIAINKSSERINRVKAEDVIGKNMQHIVDSGLIDRSVTLEVIKNQTTITMVRKRKRIEGGEILTKGYPIFNSAGELEFVVINERDVTALSTLRDQLEENRTLAEGYRSELTLLTSRKKLASRIVTRSEKIRQVMDTALKVAQVDTTILITGESGVGKGYLANIVHEASLRKDGPFIVVNCGALPETLIESELFGYEHGAFTGAKKGGKSGHFEIADGGTLFLDEIGDLPLNMQVKLLKFLETNEIVRLGGTKTKKIDVRVIAATNRNLEDMTKRKEFRSDLYFRLNVVSIYIPPLRDRPEDIPPLVEYFIKNVNEKYSTHKTVSRGVIHTLSQLELPGNIRELANVVEQMFVLASGNKITRRDLPPNLPVTSGHLKHSPEDNALNLERAVQNLERRMISHALRRAGTQSKAAHILGIDQSTLSRKAKRLGINTHAILHFYE